MPPVDAGWIDEGSFVLAYPVSIVLILRMCYFYISHLILSNQGNCELYTLTAVNADGLPASGDTSTTNVACNLMRSTSIPSTEAMVFTLAGDLVSINSPGPSLRSIVLTTLPKFGEIESPRYHALCEINTPIAQTEVHASASLVLDVDSIVIGYSKS